MVPAGATSAPNGESHDSVRKVPAERPQNAQPQQPPGPDTVGKDERVRAMFSEIAPTYDLLNRVLSLGIDQRWRRQAARTVLQPFVARQHVSVLDVASGTGDLTLALKRRRPDAHVLGTDFAEPMLELARAKSEKAGLKVDFMPADGTNLPFDDAQFDAVTIAYGLRNFADPDKGLREFRRVLKPGGRLAVLEFPPPPKGAFGWLFRLYFRQFLPHLGGLMSGKRSAYAYLPESVFAFFEPAELEERLRAAGFGAVTHELQTFGVSALHVADVPPTRREA